jgi:hypothetical protein
MQNHRTSTDLDPIAVLRVWVLDGISKQDAAYNANDNTFALFKRDSTSNNSSTKRQTPSDLDENCTFPFCAFEWNVFRFLASISLRIFFSNKYSFTNNELKQQF